jgi:hypothetical protein
MDVVLTIIVGMRFRRDTWIEVNISAYHSASSDVTPKYLRRGRHSSIIQAADRCGPVLPLLKCLGVFIFSCAR